MNGPTWCYSGLPCTSEDTYEAVAAVGDIGRHGRKNGPFFTPSARPVSAYRRRWGGEHHEERHNVRASPSLGSWAKNQRNTRHGRSVPQEGRGPGGPFDRRPSLARARPLRPPLNNRERTATPTLHVQAALAAQSRQTRFPPSSLRVPTCVKERAELIARPIASCHRARMTIVWTSMLATAKKEACRKNPSASHMSSLR